MINAVVMNLSRKVVGSAAVVAWLRADCPGIVYGPQESVIPDIAEACGFKYVEHMIPVFKKHHGNTPSRYRANARLGM
jgi:hypothetical protein